MAKQTYSAPELGRNPLPKTGEGQIIKNNDTGNLSKEIIPREPPEIDIHPTWEDAEIVVSGPRYGDVIVKVVIDGSVAERFSFRVTDGQRNEVGSKTDINEIPHGVNAALLKAGWFCTDWDDLYTAPNADYLITYAAACRHFSRTEEYDDNTDNPDKQPDLMPLLNSGYNPEELANALYDAAIDIQYSKLLKQEICHEDLREELEQRIEGDAGILGPSEAITAAVDDLADENNSEDTNTGRGSITLVPDEDATDQPGKMVYHQLFHGTHPNNFPNSCIHYLPEFGPTTSGLDFWSDGLPASDCFHFPYQDITERYDIYTQTVNGRGGEFLQVGVTTSWFTFYEQFKKIDEGKYQAVDIDSELPAIYCAAVLREKGYKITNLPTVTEPTLEDLYQTVAETIVKVFKKDNTLHEGTIEKLSTVGSIIRSQALSAATEGETIQQENLPGNATGDGYHRTIKREDIESGLMGRLPDNLSDIDEAAPEPPTSPI
jgi:hypothetical protein